MITADPGTTFSASVSTGVPGQTVSVQVLNPGEQQVVIPRTNAGVTEFPVGSGIYGVELVAPLPPGLYMILWDWAGAAPITPSNSSTDQLVVNWTEPRFVDEDVIWPWGLPSSSRTPGEEVSDAGAGSSAIPTAADVRAASNLSWTDYGPKLAQDTGPGGLQEMVDRAESAFYNITGQKLDSIDTRYTAQIRRVIQGMTETVAMQESSDVLDTLSDWDLISSFTAGPYSENHRDPQAMFQGRMLWPVPWISQALWGLLSDERYGYWMSFFTGTNLPAFQGTDVFWEDGQVLAGLYGPAGLGYWWGA